MSVIEVVPASVERFADVEHALTGGGDGGSCWCQWWMLTAAQWDAAPRDARRDMLRRDLAATPASGLVAYVDGQPAGWVKIAPRPAQPRLTRSRTTKQSPTPIDDPGVWAVTCFVVRREFRGQGVSARLLDAAVAHARGHGAHTIEGYPIDTDAKKTTSNELFHGALSTFLAAGFTEVARTTPSRPIVALALR